MIHDDHSEGPVARIRLNEVQTISGSDGRPTHAVVPWPTWTEIAAAIKSNEAPFRSVSLDEEIFSANVAKRLAAGENPVKIYREYRHMTQAQLARLVGTTPAYVSQIESGFRRAGDDLLRLIARALDIEYGDVAMPALPTVEDMVNTKGRWNPEREIVSCMFSINCVPQYVSVSLEALEDLEHSDSLSVQQAEKGFERHRKNIREGAARAVAEGRRQRDGVLLLVTADF